MYAGTQGRLGSLAMLMRLAGVKDSRTAIVLSEFVFPVRRGIMRNRSVVRLSRIIRNAIDIQLTCRKLTQVKRKIYLSLSKRERSNRDFCMILESVPVFSSR